MQRFVILRIVRRETENSNFQEHGLASGFLDDIHKMLRRLLPENILLEAVVREVACRILEGLGYRVVQAENVRAALEMVEREGAFDLIVTDVVMPGGSGTELAKELKVRGIDARMLYISGYADQSITLNGFLEEGNAFLQKPFTPTSLAEKVREVLDNS